MAGILLRACFFLLMVILGYGMKKAGVLTKDDGVAVARVVLNITLPCAILASFRTFVFEWGYMVIPLISFAANWAMLGIGYMISRRSGRENIASHRESFTVQEKYETCTKQTGIKIPLAPEDAQGHSNQLLLPF